MEINSAGAGLFAAQGCSYKDCAWPEVWVGLPSEVGTGSMNLPLP